MRRINGTGYENQNMHKPKKINAILMIWLYIGSFGKGDIFIAENNKIWDKRGAKIKINKNEMPKNKEFNNISYTELIEHYAIPSIKDKINDFIFVQDNSRVQTSLEHTGNTIYDFFFIIQNIFLNHLF